MSGAQPLARLRLSVRGAVQGVGFRPHVYRLARALALGGSVRNAPSGVLIEVEGPPAALGDFATRLRAEAPATAHVSGLTCESVAVRGEAEFTIAESSQAGAGGALLPPDRATCAACTADLFTPGGRHAAYAFTACAVCGPRFSVIAALPYDRARTALVDFPLCPSCARGYRDPTDRRFHAETQACPACGPRLRLCDGHGRAIAADAVALGIVVERLRDGGIVMVKGIGGFHLMCRADSGPAVATLRARKRRPTKPFAVMFPDLAAIAAWCDLAPAERAELCSPAAPIVLLRHRPGSGAALAVAPGNPHLGAMLPYAPLHHLLMAALGVPVVATSANLAGEPLPFRDADALAACETLADAILLHDRAILRPVEDSVVRVVGGAPLVLRLGRGLAPLAIAMAAPPPPLLALGGHLKNAPGVTVGAEAVLGPQLGDLDQPRTLAAHMALRADLCRMHGVAPSAVVCDAHPDDVAGASRLGLPVVRVQHHLAHVASAMAEHGLAGPVLGLAWDGAGHGTDGTVWGGEFLLVEGAKWRRFARLLPFPLPGGDAAAREPARAAVGLLVAAGDVAWPEEVGGMDPAPLRALCRSRHLSPLASSAGRLFDAVAFLLGLCARNTFEGEAAMALETCADGARDAAPGYPFALVEGDPMALDWRPALRALLADLARDADRPVIAARFYRGLVAGAAGLAARAGVRDIVLTGGCFQSALLTVHMTEALAAAGLRVHRHHRAPPGDGGLALGQLEWARRLAAVE